MGRLASNRVVIRSHICNPVWDAIKTRNEARIAAALASSPALLDDSTFAGCGARFRKAAGDRVMRYSWSVLYSFALMVYRSALRRTGSTFEVFAVDGGDELGSVDAMMSTWH